MSNTEQQAKNPPVAKIRVGVVTASIFENRSEKGVTYSVTLERRYRDTEGNWHSSKNYNINEMLEVAKAADLAHTKILDLLTAGE